MCARLLRLSQENCAFENDPTGEFVPNESRGTSSRAVDRRTKKRNKEKKDSSPVDLSRSTPCIATRDILNEKHLSNAYQKIDRFRRFKNRDSIFNIKIFKYTQSS